MTYIAIVAKPQHIRSVRRSLRRKGYNAYVPALSRVKLYQKAPKRRHHINFLMRYILVEIPHKAVMNLWLYDVISTKNVAGYLRSGDELALVADREVFMIRNEVALMRRALAKKSSKDFLRIGEKARLAKGTLEGKIGVLQWIRGKKAGLEARLLGATRVIEVSIKDLEAA